MTRFVFPWIRSSYKRRRATSHVALNFLFAWLDLNFHFSSRGGRRGILRPTPNKRHDLGPRRLPWRERNVGLHLMEGGGRPNANLLAPPPSMPLRRERAREHAQVGHISSHSWSLRLNETANGHSNNSLGRVIKVLHESVRDVVATVPKSHSNGIFPMSVVALSTEQNHAYAPHLRGGDLWESAKLDESLLMLRKVFLKSFQTLLVRLCCHWQRELRERILSQSKMKKRERELPYAARIAGENPARSFRRSKYEDTW